MKIYFRALIFIAAISLAGYSNSSAKPTKQPVYRDIPFKQEMSIKYYTSSESAILKKVYCDRNGDIKILSAKGILRPSGGAFQIPGTIEKDRSYRPIADKKLKDMELYQEQFVFLDDKAVLSNSWAGKFFSIHMMENVSLFSGGDAFSFLISDGQNLKYLKDSNTLWEGKTTSANIKELKFDSQRKLFWILSSDRLFKYSPLSSELKEVFKAENLTSFDLSGDKKTLYIGTSNGYFQLNPEQAKIIGVKIDKLPSTNITVVKEINGQIWFGSSDGAFQLRDDAKYNFFNGERWLPGNNVIHISKGEDQSVLILTNKGLAKICYISQTLEEKALYYEKQVRLRHIRNGFNSSYDDMKMGNLASGRLSDSDNDGLWTSMYLGAEVFRYAVTKSEDALQNCRESLDAMERLYTINGLKGFPSRSFERSGYKVKLSDPDRWQNSPDPEWDWKATTSSDEAIGHIFVYGAIAELMGDTELKAKAVHLIDILMQHIVDHDMYLIDFNGKPTLWGKWNPEYVNARPWGVGDRKVNASNIIAMLQTAYYFTHKEIFREKAFELMQKHGYLKNLMFPMKSVRKADEKADDWSKMLSESWNHSDDEMYFLGYWGLYRYAFNDTLKVKYKDAIIDHWQIERPEKEGAWNIFTALTGTDQFDLDESVWWLKEYPLDMIDWVIMNSNRKDIQKIEPNFREQTTSEVLPPDERPNQRHNGNMFNMDRLNGNGTSEHSAGDIWLLPYWLGRYLGVISTPVKN